MPEKIANKTATILAAIVVAGILMEEVSLAAPLVLGAVLKITYDLLLFRAFRRVRPPEEMANA